LPRRSMTRQTPSWVRASSRASRIHATPYPVSKWTKDDAGIEDVSKIGLKGSPTVVSRVFGPTPRSEKAEMMNVENSSLRDISLNLLQSIFTVHPTLEQDLVEKFSA